jgi:hypothetical protein
MVRRRNREQDDDGLPKPSRQFAARSWRQFQRALDPLGKPRPLPRRGSASGRWFGH